ncbi:hypothetical protein GIB67_018941, partial [Kingdonia uniflora]
EPVFSVFLLKTYLLFFKFTSSKTYFSELDILDRGEILTIDSTRSKSQIESIGEV